MVYIVVDELLEEAHCVELLSLILEMVMSLVLALLENDELLSLPVHVLLLAESQFQR